MRKYYLPAYSWLYLLILGIGQILNRMSDLIFHHSKRQYIINCDIFYFLFSLWLITFAIQNRKHLPKYGCLITALIFFDTATSLLSDFISIHYNITVFTSIEYSVVLTLVFLTIKNMLNYGK
jgi:hypothetical protein